MRLWGIFCTVRLYEKNNIIEYIYKTTAHFFTIFKMFLYYIPTFMFLRSVAQLSEIILYLSRYN